MLTGRELYDSGVITNALEENVQQQGIDVRVSKIKIVRGMGDIPCVGKTQIPTSLEIQPNNGKWILNPGNWYEVEFEEGCKLNDHIGFDYKTRSSLIRCGAIIHSGHFDPGFVTEHCGAYLEVNLPITIEVGARLAQICAVDSNEVKNVYNGQWQGDNQREN